ncbi:MAG: transcription antitermination factor NusB [Planctomycetota bacterium]
MPATSRHARDDTPATSARDLAARVLTAQAARFPEIEAVELDTSRLDDREAALAHALYDAAIRRWLTLEWLLTRKLSRPFRELEPALRAALLIGAAQLVLFDRIPVHAAIDEAVEWAKRRIRPGAGSIVNAVLRKVASDLGERTDTPNDADIPLDEQSARTFIGDWPADQLHAVAARYSMPPQLIRRWRKDLSRRDVLDICTHGLTRPPTILNTRHQSRPLPADTIEPHRHEHHALWTGSHQSLGQMLADRGDVWVQDPASSGSIDSIRGMSPTVIGDLCAGQGTKTRQLAATFAQAAIVATDTDRTRFAALRQTFRGDERVRVLPPHEASKALAGAADLILLDVPCSNTGVLGRRVEARYRCTRAALERLTGIQRQLIADSVPLLAPKGRILYATCSIEQSENDQITAWAAQWHRFRPDFVRRTLPTAHSGPASSVDGSFSTLLTRG